MGRLIDADKEIVEIKNMKLEGEVNTTAQRFAMIVLQNAPTVEAIPKDRINKAIAKIEQYICDVETDTVKAQGMAQALDMLEQTLGDLEDGKND